MNELIIKTDPANPITMSSLEIAELTGKEHRNVMRDIRAMLSDLYGKGGVLSFEHTHRNPQNGQKYSIFRLPKDLSLTLVAGYNVKLRKRIIDRWMELEEQVKTSSFDPDSLSRMDILKMALESEQERLKLSSQVEELKPKAEALDRISASDEHLTITQSAKVLGLKRETLTNWMSANGWIYRQNGSWVGYQRHIRNGNLIYKEAKYTDDEGKEVLKPYCHLTGKGMTTLAQQLEKLN